MSDKCKMSQATSSVQRRFSLLRPRCLRCLHCWPQRDDSSPSDVSADLRSSHKMQISTLLWMKSSCCLSLPADPISSLHSNIVCTYISICLRLSVTAMDFIARCVCHDVTCWDQASCMKSSTRSLIRCTCMVTQIQGDPLYMSYLYWQKSNTD